MYWCMVHGAWGSAAEFDDVVSLLSDDASKVVAIDLPGHGEDKTAISEVTMDAYVQHVIAVVKQINEKVFLVGHSLAGAVISQVAEAIPNDIDRLIYVAAMLPKHRDTPLALMQSDANGQLLPNVVFSKDQSYATLSAENVKSLFLHDVIDAEKVSELLPTFANKQATEPLMAHAYLTQDNFGRVPKYYIRAVLDKVLSLSLQDQMIQHWKVEKILTLESGHFPQNSMPSNLVDAIKKFT